MSLILRRKSVLIAVTNVCNLQCGGCCQLVGSFPREKLFFASIEEIRSNVAAAIRIAQQDWDQPWFPQRERVIGLQGAEPTVHPRWPEILQMLIDDFPDYPFLIFTNGERNKAGYPQSGSERFAYVKERPFVAGHLHNLFWRVDAKEAERRFMPTLVAPRDLLGHPDPSFYVTMARERCAHWTDTACGTMFYRNRAYFCENAGPMDWLFHDGTHGWPLDVDHPFDKTEAEVNEQAKLFCPRCYYCLGRNAPIYQSIHEKSLASAMNLVQLRPGSFSEWK